MFLGTRTTFIGLFLLGEQQQQQQENIALFDIIFGNECKNLNLIFKATLRPVRPQVTHGNLTCNTGYYGSGTIGSLSGCTQCMVSANHFYEISTKACLKTTLFKHFLKTFNKNRLLQHLQRVLPPRPFIHAIPHLHALQTHINVF